MSDLFALPGVDELFDGDIADFTRRRDELAKQIKKDGDKDAAAAIKALRKPTTAVWAVNQMARRNREKVGDLVRAAGDVRDAQARAVSGRDDGSLRTATRNWRDLVNELAALVARDAGEQYRDDAAAMLQTASTTEQLADVLIAGRFTTAVSSAGFGLEGMPDPPERELLVMPEPEPEPIAAEPEPEPEPEESPALVEARQELEKLTHRLRRAEQRLEQAQQAVDEATAKRDAAAEALRELER
jgi:hypothetical protein